MVEPTDSTIDKLALAKEMYFLGMYHGAKDTRVDRMQSILNFDFSVATTIITICGDNGLEVKNRIGKSKNWKEILDLLGSIYPNTSMMQELDSLHDVRNLIQHGGKIPSEYDVKNYEKLVKDFIQDVCFTIYGNQLTFETISIARLLKSPHEQELLQKAEQFKEQSQFDLSLNLIHTTALYHYKLIKENLDIPSERSFFRFDRELSREVKDSFENLWNGLSRTIDTLSMGKFYTTFQNILSTGNELFSYGSEYLYFHLLKFPENTSLENLEKSFSDLYNFLFGTEHLITNKIMLEFPMVYGANVTDISSNSVTLNYGLLLKPSVKGCKLVFIKTSSDQNVPEPIQLPKEQNYHKICLDNLVSGKEYRCEISITYSTKHPFLDTYIDDSTTSRITFQTK